MGRLIAALISLSAIWGLSFVFIKLLTESTGVWSTVFFRCAAGALVLWLIMLIRREKIPSSIPWRHLFVIGALNAAIPWGFIAWSETVIPSTTASVLNALTPLCTALIGLLLFKKKLNMRQWTGLGIGFLGILLLIEFDLIALFHSNFIGIGTMIIATCCYGFSSHYLRTYMQGVGIVFMTAMTLSLASVMAFGGMVLFNESVTAVNWTPTVILSIIGLGCLGSGIAHLIFNYMVRNGSPEFAATVTYLIPITALLWGVVLLGEVITPTLFAGMLVIFAGVYISNRPVKPAHKKARAA